MSTLSIENDQIMLPTDGFIYRRSLEKQLIDDVQKGGERWPDSQGSYNSSSHSLIDQKLLSQEHYQKMVSLELEPPTLHDQLRKFITRLKEIKPAEQPVIILDIGGGAGLSWGQTAALFEEDVKSGTVAFVVSNLSWTKEQFINPNQLIAGTQYIHYLNTPFRQLCRQSINLPDGRVVPLRGAVDIAHECQSLTRWSQVPEVDILSVYGLLSEYGSYYVAPLNTPCKYTKAADVGANQYERQMAVIKTHNLLQRKYGLRSITKVERGDFAGAELLYKVFRKINAPEVEI